MNVLVTGGTGFIGSHVVERLLERKFKVYALVRDPQKLKWLTGTKANLLTGDLLHLPPFPEEFDYIFHLAGLTKSYRVENFYQVNHQGTINLLEKVAKQKRFPQKFIFLSTLAVSGPSSSLQGIKEEETPRPITHYGRSKLLAEEECRQVKDKFPVAIIRVSAVYGPRDKDFLPFFQVINKGIIPLVRPGQRFLSLCYIDDLIQALEFTMDKEFPSGEIFHVAHPQPVSWDELGLKSAKALERRARRLYIPIWFLFLAAIINFIKDKFTQSTSALNPQKYKDLKQKYWVANTSKIQKLLGFQAQYDLLQGLTETITWYRHHHWL